MWLLAGPIKCNWPSVTLWSVFQYPVTYAVFTRGLFDRWYYRSKGHVAPLCYVSMVLILTQILATDLLLLLLLRVLLAFH